jgi:hypothetical protein
MRNTITLRYLGGNPVTGKAVSAYEWQEDSPFYGDIIGTFTEISGTGQYYLDLNNAVKATILINSVREEAWTGILLNGETFDGGVFIEDGTITPAKTTFAEDY